MMLCWETFDISVFLFIWFRFGLLCARIFGVFERAVEMEWFSLLQLMSTIANMNKHILHFCRSYLKSFRYLFEDVTAISMILILQSIIESYRWQEFNWFLGSIQYILLPILQGCLMSGIFQVGHDCGHGAFSPNTIVNDIVGTLCQTIFFFPYFSWKFSHAHHHFTANHLSKDGLFTPYTTKRSDVERIVRIKQGFLATATCWDLTKKLINFAILTVASYPFFLLFDTTRRPLHYNNCVHSKTDKFEWIAFYNPFCCYFNNNKRKMCLVSLSIACVMIWMYFLYVGGNYWGFWIMLRSFWLPHMVSIHIVVSLAVLNHNHEKAPKYHDKEWNWLRGQLSTCDWDLGFLNFFTHNACNTHVIHHLFCKMPHYHQIEATKCLLENVPEFRQYYIYQKEWFHLPAVWKAFNDVWFVNDWKDKDIAFFEIDVMKITDIVRRAVKHYGLKKAI